MNFIEDLSLSSHDLFKCALMPLQISVIIYTFLCVTLIIEAGHHIVKFGGKLVILRLHANI